MTNTTVDVDLSAYRARIDYRGPMDPTLAVLADLIAAHNRSIPFENVDPLFGVPVDDLTAPVLADKLLHRRRGGYCYEHNGLLGYVLEQMGLHVERLAGRVVWMQPPDAALPAMTHTVLAVTGPELDGPHLVDVGFGGQTPTSPIRVITDVVQETRHEPYRLVEHAEGLALEAQVRGHWTPLYAFSTQPRPPIDLVVGSWYVSTHPSSGFVTGLTAAMVTDDARWNLRGRNLAIHRDGSTEKIRFDTAAEVMVALDETFGIDLSDVADPEVAEARITQVLDA
ncbi:MAG: arylamine N-acetyltransferase [Mycobacterium sp.]